MKTKTLAYIALICTVLCAWFFVYGVTTQCENVAIYEYCGEE